MAVDRNAQDGAKAEGRRRWWRGRRASRDEPRRGLFASVSLATRLALVALLVTLISLVVTATVGLVRGNDLADELADDQVVTIAASKADSVELYFRGIGREISSLAASPGTRDAIEQMTEAYRELSTEPVPRALEAELTQYYLSDIVPALESVRGRAVGTGFLQPIGSAAIHLQANYSIPQVDEDGTVVDPVFVVDAGDGSAYSGVHSTIHETYGQIALRSGFDDLFLVTAEESTVVYSARKRIDFATSLALGPLSGTPVARLMDVAAADADGTGYAIADFSAYPPTIDQPRSFVASAVRGDDGLVGYVVAVLSVDPLDSVLSGDRSWPGLGEAGDVYLAGVDGTMRSTARSYQESPNAFLADSTEPGPGQLTDDQRRTIEATGTTALVQGVNRGVLTLAESGTGTVETLDFRGSDVLTGYRPVDVGGLGWVVLADVPTDEVDGPIERYARHMLFAVALFIVVVTFVAVRWSNRLMAPIRAIATRLRQARAAPSDATPVDVGQPVPSNSPAEYDELARNIDEMLRRLRDHQQSVNARAEERAKLLRQFLPAAIARRSEQGDTDVVDQVGNASVVVIVFDGIGDLTERQDPHTVRRQLADIVDEADALATELGLERIKIAAGMYVAVCGASRPYLDHAPRSVAFALGVSDLAGELSGGRISARAGVDDGAIAVGLAGRSGLVYDAWGSAVAEAERLATGSPAGSVAVSAVVRRQLPDDFVIAGDEADDGQAAVVTGRVGEEVSP
jgi:class 3 adenylate cyclase